MEFIESALSQKVMSKNFPAFACPKCRAALQPNGQNEFKCQRDKLLFKKKNNIWRFLLPQRVKHFENFISDYEKIRAKEGRGSRDSGYYQALPFRDLSGKFSGNWLIRAKSYVEFVEQVLNPFGEKIGRPARILDLGAGNGWLSNRLTQLGHHVAALDILTGELDGLAAAKHYAKPFELVQAEYESLPFPEHYFDSVIFNASLHYSENYAATLKEALRILDENGLLVILDSPIYHDRNSGAQMVKEREDLFEQKYGFPSNSLSSENYLTFKKLAELTQILDIKWKQIKPNYGIKWRLKPASAKLRGLREPAKFIILVGQKIRSGVKLS